MENDLEKKACSYVYKDLIGNEFPCPHPTYENHEHCVFHHEDVEAKEDDFQTALKDYIEKCETEESIEFYDFKGFIFPTINFSKKEFLKDAHFSSSTFTGSAHFSSSTFTGSAHFSSSTFKEKADFNSSTFTRFAFFISNTFTGDAAFNSSTFTENAAFSSSTFTGDAAFNSSTFTENAYFNSSTFTGFPDFRSSTFTGDAHFSSSTFTKYAYFSSSTFKADVFFSSTIFNKHTELNEAHFEQKIYLKSLICTESIAFNQCFFKGMVYSLHQGEKISFNQCKFYEESSFENTDCSRLNFLDSDLSEISFLGADIKETRFQSCQWKKFDNSPYHMVANHQEIMNSGDEQKIKLLGSLYQQLKQNFEENHNFALSGDFHFREMQIREKQLWIWGNAFWESLILSSYHLIADFGENYKKIFICLIGSILGTTWMIKVIEGISFLEVLPTVGYGIIPLLVQRTVLKSVEAYHWQSKILLTFEGLFAIVLTTLFIMAVRRRFRR